MHYSDCLFTCLSMAGRASPFVTFERYNSIKPWLFGAERYFPHSYNKNESHLYLRPNDLEGDIFLQHILKCFYHNPIILYLFSMSHSFDNFDNSLLIKFSLQSIRRQMWMFHKRQSLSPLPNSLIWHRQHNKGRLYCRSLSAPLLYWWRFPLRFKHQKTKFFGRRIATLQRTFFSLHFIDRRLASVCLQVCANHPFENCK